LIASWEAALQLPKDIAAAPFGIGLEPGDDQLPLSLKAVIVGTPPASATPFIARRVGKQEQPIIRNEKEEERERLPSGRPPAFLASGHSETLCLPSTRSGSDLRVSSST